MDKIEPASLEEFGLDLEEEIKQLDIETLEKRRKVQEHGLLSPEDEKEILEKLLSAVTAALKEELPFFLAMFVRKSWIKKIATKLFRSLIKKITEILRG